jgi:hypothetical protein
MSEEQKPGDVLEVMFPEKEVDLGSKRKITVSPVSLEDLPKIAKSFGKVLSMAETGKSPAEIAITGLEEILQIIPYCIDIPPKEVPSTAVPEIIEIVIEQNITEESVGKWSALIQKAIELQAETIDLNQGKEKLGSS